MTFFCLRGVSGAKLPYPCLILLLKYVLKTQSNTITFEGRRFDVISVNTTLADLNGVSNCFHFSNFAELLTHCVCVSFTMYLLQRNHA